jgi:hypothetical protein
MVDMRNPYSILDDKLGGKKPFGRLGKVILKWLLKKGVRMYIGFIWLAIASSGRLLFTQ